MNRGDAEIAEDTIGFRIGATPNLIAKSSHPRMREGLTTNVFYHVFFKSIFKKKW